jgi:hypothetical protein
VVVVGGGGGGDDDDDDDNDCEQRDCGSSFVCFTFSSTND